MPSSTSSSKKPSQAPPGPWLRIWIVAGLLGLLTFSGLEVQLRAKGFRPTVADDMNLWAYWRDKAETLTERDFIVVGTSRMNLGFDLEAWQEKFPGRKVVQLAVDGTQPLATLLDLARDQQIKATVILDVPAGLIGWHLADQTPQVRYYRQNWNGFRRIDCWISTWLKSRLVIANSGIGFQDFLASVRYRRWPNPTYVQMLPTRSRNADFTLTRIKNQAKALSPGQVETLSAKQRQSIDQMRGAIDELRARGEKVILVRTPTSGTVLENERISTPRDSFWAPFTAPDGIYAVNFEDVEAMKGMSCPDGAHLDQRDKRKFTLALADELIHRGALQ